jgi:transposase InsO family protein
VGAVAGRPVLRFEAPAHVPAIACRQLGIRHLRTQAYRPQTNGKAERFIQTPLREWAYGRAYRSSAEGRARRLAARFPLQRSTDHTAARPPATRLMSDQGA